MLVSVVEGDLLQFPTAVIASRLSRDDKLDMPHKATIVAFVNAHPDFEFVTTNITSYLAPHKQTAFKGVDDPPAFTDQLEKMQRVIHVAPRYDQMRSLLASGLDSAQSISRFSKEKFVNDFKVALGGTDEAEKVLDAASQQAEACNKCK